MTVFRDNWTTQLRKGVLEYAVLLALKERRRYGYGLVGRLTDIPGLVVSEGTVYPLLNRLKREGLVEGRLEESRDGPARKYYHLTPRGEEMLDFMQTTWADLITALEGFDGGGKS